MKPISINTQFTKNSFPYQLSDAVDVETQKAYHTLTTQSGEGSDFLGWINLPSEIDNNLLSHINEDVKRLKAKADVIIIIGIGGSYLGARAVIEALNPIKKNHSYPEIIFSGNNLNGLTMNNLLIQLSKCDYALVVISKSGTTTEPAIAFRILSQHLVKKYGAKEAASRTIAITDKTKGTLKNISDMNHYSEYVVPDNIGGRYSVLTPVGLVPIALGGFDINKLILGAKDMSLTCNDKDNFTKSLAYKYALTRNILYAIGYNIEILVNYLDHLNYLSEWWKQLYGESEGKEEKGLFPASVSFTTDLHSLGQFIQGGSKILFETVLHVDKISKDVTVPFIDGDIDGLNYLAGKTMHGVNKVAEQATISSHFDGKIPNIIIKIPKINEYYLGQLIYMFEFACGISGYVINVNPFNQPDVEGYKKNMFRLLGKPL